MAISVLHPLVAAGIAAGEIVERPASVVKELVENSLDAGATQISVEIKDGGMDQITISDNGRGIPYDEMELAFTRHATSKLTTLDDLTKLSSMGFRGEALPSIAAASKMEITSRVQDSISGTAANIINGNVEDKRQVGAPLGTTIKVISLFENLPARRKYLRGRSPEASRISRVVMHLSMTAPGVRFSLVSDGRRMFFSPGNGSLRDTLAAIYGSDTAAKLIEVQGNAEGATIHGLITTSLPNRANRSAMNIFVNRRWVQSRTLAYAIQDSYQGFLAGQRYPITSLFLEIPPDEVDVNIHPAKSEVRFLNESNAFSLVQRSIREALLGSSEPVDIQRAWGIHSGSRTSHLARPIPFTLGPTPDENAVTPLPEYQLIAQDDGSNAVFDKEATSIFSRLRVLGQIAKTFVVAEGPDGLYLIDQHAAHEQVNFDRLLYRWENGSIETQLLLDPLSIELESGQIDAAEKSLPILNQLGFHIEYFGSDTWLIREVPAFFKTDSIGRLLQEVLNSKGTGLIDEQAIHYATAASIACHSSVRAGHTLAHPEMEALIEALKDARNPHHCPHGRPTMIRFTTEAMAKEFGRV